VNQPNGYTRTIQSYCYGSQALIATIKVYPIASSGSVGSFLGSMTLVATIPIKSPFVRYLRLNYCALGGLSLGRELPPTRPTLAMTHPELGSLVEEIIKDIMEIADEGELRSPSSIMGVLPQLFDKVVSFIEDALAVRGPNDGVAYWAEQTYEATQRIERRMASLQTVPKTSSTSTTTAAATTTSITWASVAARPPPPSQEEVTLQQVKPA
jgi:hypothetical protein